MGIALAVVWDSIDGRFSVYQERHLIPFLQHLLYADLVVGFNSIRFDYQVLRGYLRCHPAGVLPSFDLMQALSTRVKLDVLARETLGVAKTADGLQSLQWYRDGRLDLIETYCRQDVALLRDLFAHALERQCLYSRSKEGKRITHQTPWSHDAIVEEAWKRVPGRVAITADQFLRGPRGGRR